MVQMLYVATDGDDSNTGVLEEPFATLQKVNSVVQPGTIVNLRGGTYHSSMIDWGWNASGTPGDGAITVRSYPGEHAVLDNSTAVEWAFVNGVWQCSASSGSIVMPLTDRPAVQMGSIEDFQNPIQCIVDNVSGGFLDANGDLLYNISYYDVTTSTLYFKGTPAITDPQSQAAVTNSAFNFDPPVGYYRFKNVEFQHGTCIHQQALGDLSLSHNDSQFEGCRVRYNGAGFLGGSQSGQITKCLIDLNGAQLYAQGSSVYYPAFLGHALYVCGKRMTIANNIIARQGNGGVQFTACFKDGCGLMHSTFSHNLLYKINGTEFSGQNFQVDTNMVFQNGSTFGNYISEGNWATDFVYADNFIETVSYGIQVNGGELPSGGVSGHFVVTGNVINNIGSYNSIAVSGQLDFGSSWIDSNSYFGVDHFTYYGQDWQSFEQWRSLLQANPGASSYEARSTYSAAALPAFPSDQFEKLLDAGDVSAMWDLAWNYVKSVQPNTPNTPITQIPGV